MAAPVSDAATPTRLSAPYPNPFNPSVKLPFILEDDSRVKLLVYDVAGRLVRNLIGSQRLRAGEHSYAWNGTDDSGHPVASGSYYYQLEVDGAPAGARALILIR